MRMLLLPATLLTGMAACADFAEARTRGIQRTLPMPGAALTTVRPPQAGMVRPAEFVIVPTPSSVMASVSSGVRPAEFVIVPTPRHSSVR